MIARTIPRPRAHGLSVSIAATNIARLDTRRGTMKEQPYFQVKVSSDGHYYFNMIGSDGKAILTSTFRDSRAKIERDLADVRLHAPNAKVKDQT